MMPVSAKIGEILCNDANERNLLELFFRCVWCTLFICQISLI
jgi:hypothetical protein